MSRPRAWQVVDVLVVLTLAVTAVLQVHAADDWRGGALVHDALVLTTVLPLLVRRRWPVVVIIVVTAAAWTQYGLGGELGQPWFAILLALYAVGAHAAPPAAWIGPAVVVFSAAAFDIPRLRDGEPLDEVVPAWLVMIGAWALGRWIRHRRTEAATLTERARRAEAEADERARAAVEDERARIARELHDLVSHNIGVVVLQAQGAQRSLDADPARTREALTSIENAGRVGLGEMRRLLGLLTDPSSEPTGHPQPTLAAVPDLVDGVRATGTEVELTMPTHAANGVAPGLALTGYRVVQESITNALKHAPGAPIRVSVDLGGARLRVSVRNGPPTSSGGPTESGGQGLLGMRERVRVFGGELTAQPLPDGGFEVVATLPREDA